MGYLRMLALVAALCGAVAGCGSNDGPAPPGPTAGSPQSTVRVMNNNWADVTIYVDRGSSRIRLGTVPSMTEARLELPYWITTSPQGFRFIVSPIGTRAEHTTAPVSVLPGQTVVFRVENHLAISSITVR